MKGSKPLAIIIVLQALLLVGQWTGAPRASTAQADVPIPNPGERQLAILDELKTLNGKMDHLIDLLQSGQVQVKLDNDKK